MYSAVVRWQKLRRLSIRKLGKRATREPPAEPLRFSGPHFTFETALGPNPQRPCFVCLGATTLGKNDVRGGLRRLPCERIISFPKLMRIESNLDVD